MKKSLSLITIIFGYSLFVVIFLNYTFFKNTYSVFNDDTPFFISTYIILFLFSLIFFSLILYKFTFKPLLIVITLISSLVAYFMNTYGTYIDKSMISNVFDTNINEALDLFNLKFLIYFILLGVLPSFLIYKIRIKSSTFIRSFVTRLVVIVVSLVLVIIVAFTYSKPYLSFIRTHKTLRYSINPYFWIYSTAGYINERYTDQKIDIEKIGTDAIYKSSINKKKIMIVVVGEAARYSNWSLNGYDRVTNPKLSKVSNLKSLDMTSCGTYTKYSVPCIFSKFNRANFTLKNGKRYENVLDILHSFKDISILWRDNNSDSKGVALRVKYEDYKGKLNTITTDGEARDTGMLIGLKKYLDKHGQNDNIIVLHSMGSHGPAYYKRYPKVFTKFKPVCKTSELSKCSSKEIFNAYDNTILYTDYFLSKVIDFAKIYDGKYIITVLYFGDHGESLGEHNIYLHGMPYFMAPKEQSHVASFVWVGEEAQKSFINYSAIDANKKYSHDNIFHSILGFFEVKTDLYDKKLDIYRYK